MATEQNQLQTPNDIAPDGPVADFGNIPQGDLAPSAQPAARTVQEDSADRAEPQQWRDDKRSEIFARARERRQAETTEFSGDPNDPNALYGSDVDQSDMGELEKEALRRRKEHQQEITGQQPQGQQPQRTLNGLDPQFLAQPVPIIVDGVRYEIPIEELARDFQINRAADKRFEQAKILLAQTQQFQQNRATPAGDPGNEPSEQDAATFDQGYDENAGHTTRRSVNSKELVEKIQLGSPEEAEQALADFIDQAVNREAPIDDTSRVLTALENANSTAAVEQFARANPQIAHPAVQAEVTREVQRNMALDLIQAGYTVEQLRQIAPSAAHLSNLHKQARIQRLQGVRTVHEILPVAYGGALENMRQLLGAPPQQQQGTTHAPTMQMRDQRKQQLQNQPVARRLSPSVNAPSQQRTQDQSRSAAVAKMRQARGQPV